MKSFGKNLLLWLPRVLSILLVLFTGIISYDGFDSDFKEKDSRLKRPVRNVFVEK